MKKLLLLIPIVLYIVGCGGEDVGSSFFPLAVGNIWEFDLTATMTNPDTTMVVGNGTYNLEITRETTLSNGTDVFEYIETMTVLPLDTLSPDTMALVDTIYYEETEDGILQYSSLTDTEPDTALSLPIETGKTWQSGENTTITVLGQENITVPAGSFNDCWKIVVVTTDNGSSDSMWIWSAENVGQVKIIGHELNGDTLIEYAGELQDYNVE